VMDLSCGRSITIYIGIDNDICFSVFMLILVTRNVFLGLFYSFKFYIFVNI